MVDHVLFSSLLEWWLQALSELHDRIPPFPRDVAMKIIEEDLGSSVTTYFSNISEEPVAAASFGQVAFYLCFGDGFNIFHWGIFQYATF